MTNAIATKDRDWLKAAVTIFQIPERDAILAELDAMIPDPAWPVEVNSPNRLEELGIDEFEYDGVLWKGSIPESLVAEIMGV